MMNENLPFVSLILPVRNESATIECALQGVFQQDYPTSRMEVLIADGMSTDNTRMIIQSFVNLHPEFRIRVLDNPGKIVPMGMNIAHDQAKGEIIIRVDGHCIIAPDYVRKCVEHIQNDGVDCVGGRIESTGGTRLAKAIAISMSSRFGVGNSAFRTNSGITKLVDTVPFPAYTRMIIERAGYYDEELVRNQDDEYNFRIRELGGKILLADDVHSLYFNRGSMNGLWRQFYRYGYWKVRVMQRHPHQMSLRQFVPPFFVLALIGSIFLALFPATRLLSPIIPLLYLLSNLLMSIRTAYKYSWQSLPVFPFIFATLHLSYGLGFLVGFFKFWNRWGDKTGKMPV